MQLISALIVLSVLFYQFELSPNISITWESSRPNQATTSQNNQQIKSPLDQTIKPPIPEPKKSEAPAPPPAKKPVMAPADPSFHHGESQIDGLKLYVDIPATLSKCFLAEMTFSASERLSYQTQIEVMELVYIQLDCEGAVGGTDKFYSKKLPLFPTSITSFAAKFYPDDSTAKCSIEAKSSGGIILEGNTISSLIEVGDLPNEIFWCWNCVCMYSKWNNISSFF